MNLYYLILCIEISSVRGLYVPPVICDQSLGGPRYLFNILFLLYEILYYYNSMKLTFFYFIFFLCDICNYYYCYYFLVQILIIFMKEKVLFYLFYHCKIKMAKEVFLVLTLSLKFIFMSSLFVKKQIIGIFHFILQWFHQSLYKYNIVFIFLDV